MNVLGIIPARGGSKGVIDKNIRPIAGHNLLYFAHQTAVESKKITDHIVSTDSDKIIEAANVIGAPVLKRPAELAQDHSPIVPALLHALEYCESLYQKQFQLLVLLQPTSPIRTGGDVDKVIEMFADDRDLEAVISVVPMEDIHPARMYNLDSQGWMKSLLSQSEDAQRQQLDPVYYRNGCIYAIRSEVLKSRQSLMVEKKKAYIMPSSHLANIDDERDFIISEVLLDLWKKGKL